MIRCGYCGWQNPTSTRNCLFCGGMVFITDGGQKVNLTGIIGDSIDEIFAQIATSKSAHIILTQEAQLRESDKTIEHWKQRAIIAEGSLTKLKTELQEFMLRKIGR